MSVDSGVSEPRPGLDRQAAHEVPGYGLDERLLLVENVAPGARYRAGRPFRLLPHGPHSSTNVDPDLPGTAVARGWQNFRPSRRLEELQEGRWNEAGSGGIDMPVALRVLAMGEKALRRDQG